jgi:hypothetical protein
MTPAPSMPRLTHTIDAATPPGRVLRKSPTVLLPSATRIGLLAQPGKICARYVGWWTDGQTGSHYYGCLPRGALIFPSRRAVALCGSVR